MKKRNGIKKCLLSAESETQRETETAICEETMSEEVSETEAVEGTAEEFTEEISETEAVVDITEETTDMSETDTETAETQTIEETTELFGLFRPVHL